MSLLPIISALTEANYTPQLNAVGVDSSGNYVDASGKPTSLYTQPGWFQRAFNPEARQIGLMNAEGQASGLNAQKQAFNARGAAQALDPTLNNTLYANTYDPRFSPLNRNTQSQALDYNNLGGPQMGANAQFNDAVANAQIASNKAKAAAAAGLLGNPVLGANVENQQLNYDSGEIAGNQALQPQKFNNMGLGMSNEQTQLLGQRAALPAQNQEIYNKALIGAGTTGTELTDLPYTQMGMRAGDITGLYQAEHPPVYNTFGQGSVNPEAGTITPGRAMSPEMRAAASMGMLPDSMMGSPNRGPSGTLPSGATFHVASPSSNGQPAIDPLHPDAIAQQQAAYDASHNSQISSRQAQVAKLKAEMDALKAQHEGQGYLQLLGKLPGQGLDQLINNSDLTPIIRSDSQLIGNLKHSLWDNQ